MGLFDFLFRRKKKVKDEPVAKEAANQDDIATASTAEVKPAAEPEVNDAVAPETAEIKDAPAEKKPTRKKAEPTEADAPANAEEQPKVTKPKKQSAKVDIDAEPVIEPVTEETSSNAADEAAEDGDKPKRARTGKFEIKKTKDDRYVFNLYASNHVIVATSQIYSSVQSAMTGIKSIIANAERAPIEDTTLKTYDTLSYPKWEIYLDNGGQYRFRLYATNGSCVVHSQGYTAKTNCKKGIESIIKTARDAEISKAYLKKAEL